MRLRLLSIARLSFPLASALAAMFAAPSAHATQLFWDGAGSWLTPNDWGTVSGGPYTSTWTSGDDAVFNVANSTIAGAATSFNSITANENVTVSGSALLTGTGTGNITVAAGKTLAWGTSNLAGNIVKLGDGEMTIGQTNSGITGFTLQAGTVTVATFNALGSNPAVAVLNLNGGTLASGGSRDFSNKFLAVNFGGNFAVTAPSPVAGFTFNAPTSLGNAARTITTNTVLTLNGIVSGSGGGIIKEGAANLILGAVNHTYTGATTINAGGLNLNGSLTGGGDVSTSGTGILTQGASSVISGASNITQGSSGISTLAGSNTYTGTTTATAGVLLTTKAAALTGYDAPGADKVTFNGGTIAARIGAGGWTTAEVDTLLAQSTKTSGALGIDIASGSLNQWSEFSTGNFETLGLTKLGAGTLVLTEANNYTGATTVIAGTLSLTGSLSGGGAVSITGGSLSQATGSSIDGSAITTSGAGILGQTAGSITGASSFTQGSTGISVLGGSNSYSGATSITAGTLSLTGSMTGGSAIATSGTGILTQSAAGVISGAATIAQGSSGTSTLAGTNTYTGTTTATAGTLLTTRAAALSGYNVANKVIFNGGTIGVQVGGAGWTGTEVNTLLTNATKTSGSLGIDTTNGNFTLAAGFNTSFGSTLGLTKLGVNTLTLDQASSYTGPTTIAAGTLSINSIASVNGGNSALGAPTNATNGTIAIGSDATAAQLTYTGTAQTTDRVINLAGTTGGAILDQSGTGALKFTSALTATGAGAKTLTLQGSTAGTGEIAGAIVDSTAATAVTKAGTGTWTLSGNNTHTGVTTLSGGGTLVLDYGTNDNNKIAGSLTLNGGTLNLKGATGSHVEDVTSTFVNVGGTFVTRSGANTAKLNMNAISRVAGGTISYTNGTLATTDRNNFNGILGGWATVGSNWAVSTNAGAADTAITALASYTTFVADNNAGVSTANYQLTGGQTRLASVAANSLRISSSADNQTLALGANNLTISTNGTTDFGGILYVGENDNNYTISGTGRIQTSGTTRDIIIHAHAGTLTVNALIGPSSTNTASVTKSGAGTLVLGATNTNSGAVRVNEGTLRLTNSAGAGTTAGGIFVQNNAALELANGVAVSTEALTITGSGIANAGALRNVANSTSSYAGPITIGSGGARINSDSNGSLTLTGGVVTSFANNATFGGLGNTTVSTVAISGAGGLIKDGTGTVTLSATNTYTGTTTVAAGVLAVNGSLANTSTTVQNTGTLQGSGGIGGSVTIETGGTLAPGNSIESLATGALSMATGSTFAYEVLNSSSTGADLLAVNGTISLTNVTLSLDVGSLAALGGGGWNLNDKITLISYFDAGAGITSGFAGYTDDTYSFFGANAWMIDYNSTTAGLNYNTDAIAAGQNKFVTLTLVPEPSTALLGGLGMLALLRRRRK